MNNILNGLNQLQENNQQEIDDLIKQNIKVNWRKYANKEENYLHSNFKQYRESFLNQFNSLEKGKINYELSKNQDSVSPSNYSYVESLILYGWIYSDGEMIKDNYGMGLSQTKLRYAEYLTNELNKIK